MRTADGVEITEDMTVYGTNLETYTVKGFGNAIMMGNMVILEGDDGELWVYPHHAYASRVAAAEAVVVAASKLVERDERKLRTAEANLESSQRMLADAIAACDAARKPAALATES